MVGLGALTYAILMLVVIAFQLCLTMGLPWGEASMGGKFKGKYPANMRVVSFINALILSFFTLLVLVRADLILPQFRSAAEIGFWFVLGFTTLSTVMNWITPSRIERNIWGPVTTVQLICILIIVFK